MHGTDTRFETGRDWLDSALGDGLAIPSATVISGPGGAGKPLLALGIVSSWLEAGGNVIAAPLQFPDPSFLAQTTADLYDLDLSAYPDQYVHVAFDPSIEGVESRADGGLRANLVVPENWAETVDAAKARLDGDGPGTLVFATALNLPLFSPTHADGLIEAVGALFESDLTSVFCVSTSMLEARAREVGSLADTLIEASVIEAPKRLEFQVERLDGERVESGPQDAPFDASLLATIQQRADGAKVVPTEQIKTR